MDNHCSSFVGDIKEIKNRKDAVVTASKVSQLLKYSSKKETLFKTLKEELVPGTLGFQTLYIYIYIFFSITIIYTRN